MACPLYKEDARFLKRRQVIQGRPRSVRERVPLPYCVHAHTPVAREAVQHDPNGATLLGCGGDPRRCEVDEPLRREDAEWDEHAFDDDVVEEGSRLAPEDRRIAARVIATAAGRFRTVQAVALHESALSIEVADSREFAAIGAACKEALAALEVLLQIEVGEQEFAVVLLDASSRDYLGELVEWRDVVVRDEAHRAVFEGGEHLYEVSV